MKKTDRLFIFVSLLFVLFFLFMISLWVIDVSVSAMAIQSGVDEPIRMRNLLFSDVHPNATYHAGLVLATVSFWFAIGLALITKWKVLDVKDLSNLTVEELKKVMFMSDGVTPRCIHCGKAMKHYVPEKGRFKGQVQEHQWVCDCGGYPKNLVLSVG